MVRFVSPSRPLSNTVMLLFTLFQHSPCILFTAKCLEPLPTPFTINPVMKGHTSIPTPSSMLCVNTNQNYYAFQTLTAQQVLFSRLPHCAKFLQSVKRQKRSS